MTSKIHTSSRSARWAVAAGARNKPSATRSRRALQLGISGVLGLAPHVASAATPPSVHAPGAPVEETQYSPWQSKRHTPFASLATDLGFIYARPRLTLGYGAPFWNFIGVDAYWMTTNSFSAPYIGWRASLPFLDAMFGVRRNLPFNRRVLGVSDHHAGSELGLENGGERSVYTAIDFEVNAVAPVLHGGLFLTIHPVYVDLPSDVHVYEEVLRSVIKPPFAVGIRGGYVYGVGADQALQVGGLGEYVVLPGRPKGVTRMGPLVHATFSKHLEGFAAFSFVVDSPDTLGVLHGTYAFFGLLHRWAQRF